MKPSRVCLHKSEIPLLLLGDMPPDEAVAAESHLAECESCRSTIESMIADSHWWDDARKSLASSATHVAASLRDAENCSVEGCSAEDFRLGVMDADAASLGETRLRGTHLREKLLDLLGPTDDPNMLGRIGPYEIIGLLGQGGMGAVFKGFDRSLNRFVAIKMLLPHMAASGAARKRFAREGQAVAAVVDDHVMAIHCVDEWQGAPYLVMTYSRGVSLQKRLSDNGPLEVREILRIGMQSAKGLAAAHAQGIVHRDIKPANIFLDQNVERVQLMDFGLARAVDDASLTRSGTLAGTPQYMSPEQARAETVDHRSDLFSLGSVMYAMCTGHAPFRAESSYSVLRLITDKEPRPIREINPPIPDWLCVIVEKLMSKNSVDRYASAGEIADLLELCLAHVQQPTAVALPTTLARARKESRISFRNSVSLGVFVMLTSLCSMVAAMFVFHNMAPPDPDTLISAGTESLPSAGPKSDTSPNVTAIAPNNSKSQIARGEGRGEPNPATTTAPFIDTTKELAALQGTWCFDIFQFRVWPEPIGIGTDSNGRTSEKRMVVKGNRITWTDRQGEQIEVSFTIDPFVTPKQIDFTFLRGPNKGAKSLGIYEPQVGNDNYLWLCMTNPGTDAPRPIDVSYASQKQQSMIGIYKVASPERPSNAKALERFQGIWDMTLCDSALRNYGATQEEASKWQWTIKGDEILWNRQGEEWKLKLDIDPSKRPREADLTYLSGPFRGQKCLGMYEFGGIDEMSLNIAVQDPGATVPRPQAIAMTGGGKTGLIFLRPSQPSDSERQIGAFQGTWTLRNYDTGRWPMPHGKGPDKSGEGSELRWLVKGNEITWTSSDGEVIRASFRIDPTKRPKQIDLTFLSGTHKGETCSGIYHRGDLDENILWVCIADPGPQAARPTTFSYQFGEGRSLLSLYPFESSTAAPLDASQKP